MRGPFPIYFRNRLTGGDTMTTVFYMRKRIAHGPAIRAIRQEKNLSVSALAPLAGISQGYLSFIELGDKQPSSDALVAIADALGVPLDAISYTIPSCTVCEVAA